MQHVVKQPTPAFRSHSGALEVHQVCAWQDNFVWVIVDVAGRSAAVVDGPDAGGALELCSRLGVSLTTVLNTHTHPDHIGINVDLERRGLLPSLEVVGSSRPASAIPGQTVSVTQGDTVRLGGVVGQVLLTEGHQNGHVSYLFEDLLFCGDTLFAGGCGYLFDGPASAMHTSLQTLAALPPQTRVCCAHEYTQDNLRFAWSVEPQNPALAERIRDVWARRAAGQSTVPSTIEDERATNPFVRVDSSEIAQRVAAAMPNVAMQTPAQVFAATRKLKDRKEYKSLTDAELPLANAAG